MKMGKWIRKSALLSAVVLSSLVITVYAADNEAELNEQAKSMDGQAPTVVIDRTARTFAGFAGSEENARSLATGLRNGTEISITTSINGVESSAVFTPPTGKTGHGNVFIVMSLAQQQLTDLGVTQPSAEQIRLVLIGGELSPDVQLRGILSMRSDGMGWGQIAHSLGVKLGHVISGMRSANTGMKQQKTRPEGAGRTIDDKPQRTEKPMRPSTPGHPKNK